jgi:hypothetical protein
MKGLKGAVQAGRSMCHAWTCAKRAVAAKVAAKDLRAAMVWMKGL